MKNSLLFFLIPFLICINATTKAQVEAPKTLFSSTAEEHFGWYLSPSINSHFFSQDIQSPSTLLAGGQMGIVLHRSFLIGFGGSGTIRSAKFSADYPQWDQNGMLLHNKHPMGLGYGFGGLYLAYIHNSNEAIHLVFPVFLGFGSSNEYEIEADGDHGTTINSPGFTLIEPGLGIELNLQTSFRLFLGMSYRWVDHSRFEQLPNGALNGISLKIAFKTGKF